LIDYAITQPNRIRIFLAINNNDFVLAASHPMPQPVFVLAVDIDGDGALDLAASCVGDSSIHTLLNDGSGFFAPSQTLHVGFLPKVLTWLDVCSDGLPEIAVADVSGTPKSLFNNEVGSLSPNAVALETMTWSDYSDICGPPLPAGQGCGSEPSCSATPTGPGIQRCLVAACCRAKKCRWAACVIKDAGEWPAPGCYVAALLACNAVGAAESAGCIFAILPLR